MANQSYDTMTRTQLLNAIAVQLFYQEFNVLLVTAAELKQSLLLLRRLRDLSKSTQNYLELSATELRQVHIEKQNLRRLCYKSLPQKMTLYVQERRKFEERVQQRLTEIYDSIGQESENQTPLPENYIWQLIQPDTVRIIEEICAEAPAQLLTEFKSALMSNGETLGNFEPLLDAASRSVCLCPTDEVLNSLENFGSRLKDSLTRGSLRGSTIRSVSMK